MANKFNDYMDTDETINQMVNDNGCMDTADYCFNRGMKKLAIVKLQDKYDSAKDAAWYFNKYAEICAKHQQHIK